MLGTDTGVDVVVAGFVPNMTTRKTFQSEACKILKPITGHSARLSFVPYWVQDKLKKRYRTRSAVFDALRATVIKYDGKIFRDWHSLLPAILKTSRPIG